MNEQVNYAKIQRIQDDLDALTIGTFGTGFVTDAMLYESGIKATVTQHTSQLADITSLNLSQITFNLDNGLQKYRGCPLPKIVFWGDSITAGAGSDYWYSSWIQQFGETLQLSKGSMYGKGYIPPNNGGTPSGWTLETKGCNQFRVVSSSGSLSLCSNSGYNKNSKKLDVLYSTELDGGNFDIIVNGVSAKTVSCNGATSYGNVATVDIPNGVTYSIQASGKSYIEGINEYGYNGVTDGILVHKVGHGGFSASNFLDAEIDASIKPFKPNLTCIGHITNDVNCQDLTVFRNKIIKAIQAGKVTGDVLFYIPSRGRLQVEAPPTITFDQYKEVLYDLAKEYNCALIDIDKLWGGYSKANPNGLLADDVHPNQKGYDYMTDLLVQVLAPYTIPFRTYKINHSANVSQYYDLMISFATILGRVRFADDMYFDKIIRGFDSSNNIETYTKINKAKIVNDGTADLIVLENYGANGSIVTLKDKIYSNILQIQNANNLSYITSGKTLEINTSDADKINNPVNLRNRLVVFNGLTISAVDGTNAKPNTLFVDSSDNVLKFKDTNNVIKIVNLT